MYRVAGAFALGTDGFAAGSGRQGGLSIAFHISSDGGLFSAAPLGYSASAELVSGLGMGSVLDVSVGGSQEKAGSIGVYNAMTDGLYGSNLLRSSRSFGGVFHVPNEIKEGAAGAFYAANSLNDTGLTGALYVGSGVSAGSLIGRLSLKSSIDTDSLIVREELRFYLDGREASHRLLSAEINLFGKGIYADFTATIAGDAGVADTAEFVIYGESYSFLIEERTAGKNTCELWGRAVQVLEDIKTAEVFAENITASELAANALWQAAGYSIPVISGAYSRSALLKLLADEAGAELRICADGKTRIADPYMGVEVVNPQAILEITELEEAAQNSGVAVTAGLAAEPVIETEGKFPAASFGEVFVYTNGEVSVRAELDILKRTDRRIVKIEEQLRFTDGTASTTYPIFRLISGGKAAEGRKIYGFGKESAVCTVAYETIKETYTVYENDVREAVFSAQAVRTAFTAGSGAAVREYTQKLTVDGKAAERRAANMHKKYGGGRFLELSHLFCIEAARGESVMLKTPKGTGHVIESRITVSSAPLKIIHKTKIYCPKEINNG